MKFLSTLALTCAFSLVSPISFASERNEVVVSIKPLHSLVSAVMQGVAVPKLLVQGAGSEHVYSLKPSDAKVIERAKVIFWAGPSMETFLDKSIRTLGEGAQVVALGEVDGLTRLKFREGGPFEGHDHEAANDSHDHEENHHHEHHKEEYDLHFWLDPQNGKILVQDIARVLSESDPEHAALYKENAEAYSRKLDMLTNQIRAELEPVKSKPLVVFHDAYQYFENRFGLNVAGSITVSPEKAPGAARIKETRDKIKQLGAVCVFAEPQFEPRIINTVIEGTDAKTGTLDPLGAALDNGPELYLQLIQNLADSITDCLSR